jgi:hypothetical protein
MLPETNTGNRITILLAVLPWFWCFIFVTLTLLVANIHHPAISWLSPLTRNLLLNPLAISVVALWITSRIILIVRGKNNLWQRAAIAFGVGLLELGLGFIIYLFWAVGMIGGPINPG